MQSPLRKGKTVKHIYTEPHYPYTEVYADIDDSINPSEYEADELKPMATQPMIDLALNLVDLLPHGSGIDCTWHVTAYADYVECANELHAMDENGFYAGYYPFSVEFNAEDVQRIAADKYHVAERVMWVYQETYEENMEEINPCYADEDEDQDYD